MFGSNVLDVAIGLIFIYLLISLSCTVINEAISSLLNKRGENLFLGVKNLLNDPSFTGLAQQVYNHGMVDSISKDANDPTKINRKPSYLPSLNFSLALVDILGARGVVDAAHGALLSAAEQADDAAQKESSVANNAVRADARAALETAADQAATAAAAAAAAVAANPGVASFVQAAVDAKRAADTAKAAVAMHDARRAAIALSSNPKNVELANKASDDLETALSLGRALSLNFPDPISHIQAAIQRLPAGHTKESLAVLVDKTRRELKKDEDVVEQYRKNLESWFNDAMDRVGGWYKRWTQKILLGIAVVIVCLANVDTIHIVQRLTSDTALRASLVTAAEDASKRPPAPASTGSITPPSPNDIAAAEAATKATDKARLDAMVTQAKDLQLPLGWSSDEKDTNHGEGLLEKGLLKILGLLLTVLAVSLGAPFWFDTLSKFVNLRGAGTPPGEKSKSAPKSPKETPK